MLAGCCLPRLGLSFPLYERGIEGDLLLNCFRYWGKAERDGEEPDNFLSGSSPLCGELYFVLFFARFIPFFQREHLDNNWVVIF